MFFFSKKQNLEIKSLQRKKKESDNIQISKLKL
jgi:hypothetical protein